MITPISVGTAAIVAVPRNVNRVKIVFQNNGATTLFFYRNPNIPSATNYEFLLEPGTITGNDSGFSTNSISQFNVVSSAAGGVLSMFETVTV